MPLVHTSSIEDSNFDALLYIGNNLESDLKSHQEVFNDLSFIKQVY